MANDLEYYKMIREVNPKWLGTQAHELLDIIDGLEHDLKVVYAAFEVHCSGGSGGDNILCKKANAVAKEYGFNYDTVAEIEHEK
jgi:hypothetical protein